MDTVRTVKLIGTSLAFASLGLTALVSTAFAGKMDALLGDWADTVTDTVVNATTWKSIWKKNGKTVERELEHISADGKTFRAIDQGIDEKGKKYKNHLVFERP